MTPEMEANIKTFIRPLNELEALWESNFFAPLIKRFQAAGLNPEIALTTTYADDIHSDIKFDGYTIVMTFRLETRGTSGLMLGAPRGGFGVGTITYGFFPPYAVSYPGYEQNIFVDEYLNDVTTFDNIVADVYNSIPRMAKLDIGFIEPKLEASKEYLKELSASMREAKAQNMPSTSAYMRKAQDAANNVKQFETWVHEIGKIGDAVS